MAAPAAPSGEVALLPQSFLQPGLSLQQLWAIVWAYRKWILLTTLAVTVLTGIVSKLLPKVYEATATVLVDFEVNDPLSGRDFPSNLAASYMATQIEFIGSPTTLLPVVDRLKLVADKQFTAGYGGDTDGGLREYAMNRLGQRLSIRQTAESRIITIGAEAGDAQMAARLANTVAQVYIEEQTRRASEPARERAERYGSELEALRAKVDEAQRRVTEFRERTGLLDLDRKADLDTERLMDLDRRLTEAQSRRRDAEQRAAQTGESGADVLGSTLVQTLKAQLAAKEAELAQRSARLGRRHPDYIALQAEIASTRERLQREVGIYGGGARADAAGSRRIEEQLQAEVELQRARVQEARRLQDEGARYLRELDSAAKVYERALDGYDQVLLGSRSRYTNASIASVATAPSKHSRPKTRINLILGFLAGGFFGVAGSLLYELLDRRVRCREDVERDLGLAVLADLSEPRSLRGGVRP